MRGQEVPGTGQTSFECTMYLRAYKILSNVLRLIKHLPRPSNDIADGPVIVGAFHSVLADHVRHLEMPFYEGDMMLEYLWES